MDNRDYIGIDFGGTTISGGLVNNNQILSKASEKTLNHRPADDIFESIAAVIGRLADGRDIAGIGVGVPVPIGPGIGELNDAMNVPTMEGYPLKQMLEERFRLPILLENDARCMVLGEYMSGALKGNPDCACITLGTGLGCGVLVDGTIYRGARFWGGEIWCIPYGDSGESFEDALSIRGLKNMYASCGGGDLEPDAIHERWLDGENCAQDAFQLFGRRVGTVAAAVFCLLDPGRIAVGGGLARAYDAFSEPMMAVVNEASGGRSDGRIVAAELSDKAAVIGAASLFNMQGGENG